MPGRSRRQEPLVAWARRGLRDLFGTAEFDGAPPV